MENLAPALQVRDHARDVLDWHLGIDPVLVEKIDPIGAEPSKRSLNRLPDVRRPAVQAQTLHPGRKVDVEAELARLFEDLSDGERQRVMIARAIAQSPQLMVLDEITAFLDLPGRVEVMALLRAQARATGAIKLLSSHDLDLSLQLADIVWLLDGRGGLTVGTPQALIDDGHVGRAFDSDAVRFSPALGRFELVE